MAKEICVNDVSMKYTCFGEGSRNLVIIPGLGIQSVMLSEDAIAAAYAVFAGDFRVWLFDRRENMPGVYRIEDMAYDTAEAMKALGIKDACLFGVSQGGMMAELIAADYPELVCALALGSTVSQIGDFSKDSVFATWMALAEEGKIHELNESFAQTVYSPETVTQFAAVFTDMEKTITEKDLERFRILVKGTEHFSASEKLSRITCPVYILGSKKDRIFSEKEFREMAEKLGCELYLYENYSHAVYDEAPDYKEKLLAFFRRSPEGRK